MNSPAGNKVDVPIRVDDDTQDVSDLLGPLLLAQVVLSQHHPVNIARPEGQQSLRHLWSHRASYSKSSSRFHLIVTHQMQCPAVSTQRGATSVPPQV